MYDEDEYIGFDGDVLKTSSQDLWLRWIYLSWSKRLKDILKTYSEEEDKGRPQDVFSKTNVCWDSCEECLIGFEKFCEREIFTILPSAREFFLL